MDTPSASWYEELNNEYVDLNGCRCVLTLSSAMKRVQRYTPLKLGG
jgi:hypothetical protein